MGYKKTSETIAVSFAVEESAPGVYTELEIPLVLDILNNEIFVCLAVDINLQTPEAISGVDTSVKATLASTSSTSIKTLSSSNVIAVARDDIKATGFIDGGVGFSRGANETYQGSLDQIGFIASNNFFVGIIGAGNANAKGLAGRLFGFRAVADSSTYAALLQSEVLSA